jgi:hypothetical protein
MLADDDLANNVAGLREHEILAGLSRRAHVAIIKRNAAANPVDLDQDVSFEENKRTTVGSKEPSPGHHL